MSTSAHDTMEGVPMKLRSTVVEYDDAPNECTIYPEDVPEWDRMTTWITATEGSYVELAERR